MENNKLAICVPTYNRADFLAGCLENIIPQAQKHNIVIYVSDNASTDNTAEIIKKYQNIYPLIRYSKNQSNIGPDANFAKILKSSHAQYSWLISDDDRIIDTAVDKLMQDIQEDVYDAIVVNGGRLSQGNIIGRASEKEYSSIYRDPSNLLSELGWHMTWLSCLVYSKKMIEQIDFDKYLNTNLLQFMAIFEYLAKDKISVYFERTPLVYNFNFDPPSWYPQAFDIFGRKWHAAISSLPHIYTDEAKSICIKKHGDKSGIFRIKKVIILRLLGYYDLEIYRKYQNILDRISGMPKFLFWLIAIFPLPKVLVCWFRNSYVNLYQIFLRPK